MQVALIGAPNVGKSSLVTVLSSGKPEICNYPFTTRSVKMGHFFVDQVEHQVRLRSGLRLRMVRASAKPVAAAGRLIELACFVIAL